MNLFKRVYVRPHVGVPFYGSPEDTSKERKDSLKIIVDFHKNVMGFGDRYKIVYYSPDELSAYLTCEMTNEEQQLLLKIRNDTNSLYHIHMKLHDLYHKENGIKFRYVDPHSGEPLTPFT